MATFYITHSRKQDGAYEHLQIVGVFIYEQGYATKEEVYDSIQNNNEFVVHNPPYPQVGVQGRLSNDGNKYIQTNPDQFSENNLLNLPDC